jgi:glucokinase
MIFAVDGGGTAFKTALVDDEGNLSRLESFPMIPEKGISVLRDQLDAVFQRRKEEMEVEGTPIRAIGIGCRGIIEPETNRLLDDSGVMNFFSGHSFRELIDTNLPMRTQNDAVAAAMGENKYGVGRTIKNFVLLTLGAGIGGGIIIDGKVLQRSTEMGHFPVNPHGEYCGCGNVGCIEREFSATAFHQRMIEVNPRRGPEREIRDVKHLFTLAEEGDLDAASILHRSVFFLARAISGYANALDPERVILSGGISKAGDYLKGLLVKELRPILWRKDPETFVQFSTLGAQMGLYGAGAVGAAALE